MVWLKNYLFKLLGLFFIILSIIAVVNAFKEFDVYFVLWFCYLGIFLIGLGIFMKKDFLIVSQINILAIPMVVWSIDFFYVLIFGGSLMGITNYFFEQSSVSNFVSLQHIFTLPLVLLSLWFIKIKRDDYWKISFLQIILFYFFTYFFTPVENNINCVFEFCGNIDFGFFYPVGWFLFFLGIIFLTNFLLVKFFKRK
jgi:hypothetical protein